MNDKKKKEPKIYRSNMKSIDRTFNAHYNTRRTGLEIAIPKLPDDMNLKAGDEFNVKYRIFKDELQIIYTRIPMVNGDNDG